MGILLHFLEKDGQKSDLLYNQSVVISANDLTLFEASYHRW